MPCSVHITTVHPTFDVRIFHKEAKTLANAGYEVILISQNNRRAVVDGIRMLSLPAARNRLHRMFVLTQKAFRLALRQPASIYHIHDPELLPWGWLLQKMTGCPVIYDAHEYCADDVQTKEWIPGSLRYVISYVVDKFEKRIAHRLGGIVTVSGHMARLFGKVNANTVTVHNYPVLEFASRFRSDAEHEPFTIIYIGTMSIIHGYEIVLKTMQRVRRENPHAKCIIVGHVDRTGLSPESLLLEKELVQCGVIDLVGRVGYERIPEFLLRASIAWLPWLMVPNNMKGNPTKLFEYMCAGLPMVSSPLEFVKEIIEKHRCGLVTHGDDGDAHAEAILYLLSHHEEAREMGANGRNIVTQEYRWEIESKKLIGLYDQLLRER
jgi:glycosyltransferase involved in cell wall biosynthesis